MKSDAYQIAKAGGQHHGVYERYREARTPEIEKSIRSFRKNIALHEMKIANPAAYTEPDITEVHLRDLVERYWPNEIMKDAAKIAIMEAILKEREHG